MFVGTSVDTSAAARLKRVVFADDKGLRDEVRRRLTPFVFASLSRGLLLREQFLTKSTACHGVRTAATPNTGNPPPVLSGPHTLFKHTTLHLRVTIRVVITVFVIWLVTHDEHLTYVNGFSGSGSVLYESILSTTTINNVRMCVCRTVFQCGHCGAGSGFNENANAAIITPKLFGIENSTRYR